MPKQQAKKKGEGKKVIKAWAVFVNTHDLQEWGNGDEFQYPIFPTRKDAKSFKSRSEYVRGISIKRVSITIED